MCKFVAAPCRAATVRSGPVGVEILAPALGLTVAARMLCPNRWTVAGRGFRYRLVASILVGLYFILTGLRLDSESVN